MTDGRALIASVKGAQVIDWEDELPTPETVGETKDPIAQILADAGLAVLPENPPTAIRRMWR